MPCLWELIQEGMRNLPCHESFSHNTAVPYVRLEEPSWYSWWSGYINEIERLSDTVVADYRDKLNTRIKELLENPNEIDENRMAQEVAIYADKSSITEEIVRFNSHITQLKNTVVKDDSVGRKMDFLIQEMNREINTMGSKSSDINITNLVVEVKSELEKIREQIQNIE